MIISPGKHLVQVALCFLCLNGIPEPSIAQSAGKTLPPEDSSVVSKPLLLFTANFYYSKFIKHSPKLTTRTGQIVPGGEVGCRIQTFGNRDWQTAHHFPEMGASIIWLHPGEGAHGNLIGFFPHLSLPIYRFHHAGVFFRVGTGVGWTSRPYNTFTNPRENALGSHWNNVTQFRLTGVWGSGHWRAEYGAALTHFSNGGFALPNFGMNIPGVFAGVIYAPFYIGRETRTAAKVNKRPDRRLGANIQGGFARIEYVVIDGPKYAIWSASTAVTCRIHRFNRLALGLDWEKNNGVQSWLVNNAPLGGNRADAAKGAQRAGVFLADEFLFGSLSILIQASYHVGPKPLNTLALSRNYNKLGLRYYFPALPHTPVKPFLGLSLKAYKGVAEHIGVHAGLDF